MEQKKIEQVPVFFPIETLNRELDFRLLMAVVLSSEKFKFYIGQHDLLFSLIRHSNGVLYVGKNIFLKRAGKDDGSRLKQIKQRGGRIVYLHEEGAVYAGKAENWKTVLTSQYDLNLFSADDVVCVWGRFQLQHDRSRAKDDNLRIVPTGHPRFDLYKPKWSTFFSPEKIKLVNELKDYVLISGNYGTSNHGIGLSYVFSDAGNYNVNDPSARLRKVGFYSYTARQMISIVELVHKLAVRFPELNFVFRAHPSENEEYYKTIFRGVQNIKVRRDGPIGGWIQGAKALIHDGCSTAIEAWLAEVPVINFKPSDSEEHQIFLPNQIGTRAKTEEEVVNTLSDVLIGKTVVQSTIPDEALDLFENFRTDSVEKFAEEVRLAATGIATKQPPKHPKEIRIQLHYLKAFIKKAIVNLYSKLLDTGKAKRISYHETKFYGLEREVIDEKIKRLEKITGKTVKWRLLNSRVLIIEDDKHEINKSSLQ